MELLLASLFASPLLGVIASMSFALALLALLAAFGVVAGVYYSAPRMLVKWLSRRALQGL